MSIGEFGGGGLKSKDLGEGGTQVFAINIIQQLSKLRRKETLQKPFTPLLHPTGKLRVVGNDNALNLPIANAGQPYSLVERLAVTLKGKHRAVWAPGCIAGIILESHWRNLMNSLSISTCDPQPEIVEFFASCIKANPLLIRAPMGSSRAGTTRIWGLHLLDKG